MSTGGAYIFTASPPSNRASKPEARNVATASAAEQTIGYLAFNYWMVPMTERVRAGVAELRERGMRALILDLRGNSGGFLDQAVKIANAFLEENSGIVITRSRDRG